MAADHREVAAARQGGATVDLLDVWLRDVCESHDRFAFSRSSAVPTGSSAGAHYAPGKSHHSGTAMALRFVDYKTAVGTKNRHASWYEAHERMDPEAWPDVRPSFALDPNATILTIGSCFARNIERHFRRAGFNIPELARDYGGSSVLNKFTPPSILQEVKWAAEIRRRDDVVTEDDCRDFCYRLRSGLVIDNNLADFEPLSYEGFLERRRAVYQIFRTAFVADCIVLTPGLAEAWHDRERGIFIQKILTGHHSHISENLQFAMLDFGTCYECLDQTIAEIRHLNANAKFLITTSPIPLERTFTGEDVIVANTHAKSVLRAACGEVAAKWDCVDYFPSFENVMLTKSHDVMSDDRLHVSKAFVNKIVNRALELYVGRASDAELLYKSALAAPDLSTALIMIDRAIEAAPTTHDYRLAVRTLHVKFGDINGAIEANDRAVDFYRASGATSHPHMAAPEAKLLFRRNLYERIGDHPNERNTLIEIVKLLPHSARMHFRLGAVLQLVGDFEGSLAPLQRAWDLKTHNPFEVGLQLAESLRQVNKAEASISILLQLAEEWPDNTAVWILFGHSHLMLGNLAKAEEGFARAVEIDPENLDAAYNLNHVRQRKNATALASPKEKALATLEKARAQCHSLDRGHVDIGLAQFHDAADAFIVLGGIEVPTYDGDTSDTESMFVRLATILEKDDGMTPLLADIRPHAVYAIARLSCVASPDFFGNIAKVPAAFSPADKGYDAFVGEVVSNIISILCEHAERRQQNRE